MYCLPHLLTTFLSIGILTSILACIIPWFPGKVINSDILIQRLFSFPKLAVITKDYCVNLKNWTSNEKHDFSSKTSKFFNKSLEHLMQFSIHNFYYIRWECIILLKVCRIAYRFDHIYYRTKFLCSAVNGLHFTNFQHSAGNAWYQEAGLIKK